MKKFFKSLLPSSLNIILIISSLRSVTGIYECCPDENILFLSNSSCLSDNVNSTGINLKIGPECEFRYPFTNKSLFKEIGYIFLDNGTLLDNNNNNKEIGYCYSNNGDELDDAHEIFILCVKSEDQVEDNLYLVRGILVIISAIFVIFTIIIYCMVPKLLDLQGICIIHALVAYACGFIFLGIIQLKTDHETYACKALAYLMYFSFIYVFFWQFLLSFHIWRTTVKPYLFQSIKWSVLYHIFAIGGSLIALIIVIIAHYSPSEIWDKIRPGFGEGKCWFKSPRELWIYFYGPLIVLLIFNIFFYLWTIASLWGTIENRQRKIMKYRLKLCARLCIIMGITWILEIITFIANTDETSTAGKVVLFIIDLINILQGILIFLVLVVFRKRIRRTLANKNICNIRFPNSWKNIEDEELESAEEKAMYTVVEYKDTRMQK